MKIIAWVCIVLMLLTAASAAEVEDRNGFLRGSIAWTFYYDEADAEVTVIEGVGQNDQIVVIYGKGPTGLDLKHELFMKNRWSDRWEFEDMQTRARLSIPIGGEHEMDIDEDGEIELVMKLTSVERNTGTLSFYNALIEAEVNETINETVNETVDEPALPPPEPENQSVNDTTTPEPMLGDEELVDTELEGDVDSNSILVVILTIVFLIILGSLLYFMVRSTREAPKGSDSRIENVVKVDELRKPEPKKAKRQMITRKPRKRRR